MNEQNEQKAELLLYGEVGEESKDGYVSGTAFVRELAEAERTCSRIDVRINSIGGEVYPGIAIFNALRRCRANVTLYIDGIAASIAGVIALCGRRVEMSRYSRMMLHNVSAGCYGNKRDLQETIATIESLEDTLADIISDRCGMDKKKVKDTYFDGSDHWLTADEALKLGLVDAIYDVEPVPDDSTSDDIYRIFTNRLERELRPQNNQDMKLEDIKKIGRFSNCADEPSALNAVKEAADKADRADALEQENRTLREENEQLHRQQEEQRTQQIDEAVEAAASDGRISQEQRDTYRNLLKADYENGMKALQGMKPMRMVKDVLDGNAGSGGSDESPWDKRQREIREARNR